MLLAIVERVQAKRKIGGISENEGRASQIVGLDHRDQLKSFEQVVYRAAASLGGGLLRALLNDRGCREVGAPSPVCH